MITNWI